MLATRRRREANIVNAHLIIVTSAQIYHNMLVAVFEGLEKSQTSRCQRNVPIEKHHCAWIVQLIHLAAIDQKTIVETELHMTYLIEVWNIRNIDQVDNRKVLHFLCHRVQRLVHRHALTVPVMAETEDYDTIFF